ncbi:MAG: hypothetical protein CMC98_00915 [Flavobacteriales bacterium]|nr:hypothetical protein [Flavobacteriales bacterium]|tara:strand:- start:2953 stop:3369 length:417 start_codon:yes stop_codon:yes gene_type:complete
MTPNHYYLDIEQTFKLEDILNNFAGGLNVWKASVLKYTNRASLKHDNPLDCLNKALNCVNKEKERIFKEFPRTQDYNFKELNPIDLEIHNKALDPNSYNRIECQQYKLFLVEIYKWVIGEVSFDEIKSKIQKQIYIFS